MSGIVDSGWAAWLPFELLSGLEALSTGAAGRRRLRDLLASEPDDERVDRWERFLLVLPSRIDLPRSPQDLDEATTYAVLADLGLVAGSPPRAIVAEPVELVLTLDHDDLLDLERLRSARDVGSIPDDLSGLALPSLGATFGAGTGRNDPCPCGSGKKFKRCHGA
jgi:hypothetical protein